MEKKETHILVKFLLCVPFVLYYILESMVLLLIPKRFRYKDIEGETVLITGAGGGLGRELATKFADLGCRIILVDIHREGMEKTKEIISARGGEVYLYQCDVSKREAVYEMATKIKDEIGFVSILVNNAGVVTGKLFLEIPDEMIQKTFNVNTLAHFWTCKAFLPDMIKNNHGHIVTVASLAGCVGAPRLTDYCSSKFASIGFEESLRMELTTLNITGVKTTVVCPYLINTGLFEGFHTRICGSLTPEYVAQETVSAVLINQEVLLLPEWLRTFCVLKWLLPFSAIKVASDTVGVLNCMDNFKGRKKVD